MRIACTLLDRRIKLGRPSKDGHSFNGEPKDVTSDCLKAVIEFVGSNEKTIVNVNGEPAYEISVRALKPE